MNVMKMYQDQFGSIPYIIINGDSNNPWFFTRYVLTILGYSESSFKNTIYRFINDEDKMRIRFSSVIKDLKGRQIDDLSIYNINSKVLSLINEPGLYTLIIRSQAKNALSFQRWVTKEVLPNIRKYGVYIDTNNSMNAQLARTLGKDARKELTRTIANLGVSQRDFAIITNDLYSAIFGYHADKLKSMIGLKPTNNPDELVRDYFGYDALNLIKESEEQLEKIIREFGIRSLRYNLYLNYLSNISKFNPYSVVNNVVVQLPFKRKEEADFIKYPTQEEFLNYNLK